jgi:hypothetical protein
MCRPRSKTTARTVASTRPSSHGWLKTYSIWLLTLKGVRKLLTTDTQKFEFTRPLQRNVPVVGGQTGYYFCMPPSRWVLFFAIIGGSFAPQASAQTCGALAQSPIANLRPQITSSFVVPCGSLQFENGFQETGNGGQQSFDCPETSVQLGIASKTELRFGVPDYFYNDGTSPAFGNGFGDLTLGFKQQLGPTRGGFDVSLIPSMSFPTGSKLISSHGYDPTVQLSNYLGRVR